MSKSSKKISSDILFLKKHIPHCWTQRSKRGHVFLVVLGEDGTKYSVCHFERSKFFKIRFPYPRAVQTGVIVHTPAEVLDFFSNLKIRGGLRVCDAKDTGYMAYQHVGPESDMRNRILPHEANTRRHSKRS